MGDYRYPTQSPAGGDRTGCIISDERVCRAPEFKAPGGGAADNAGNGLQKRYQDSEQCEDLVYHGMWQKNQTACSRLGAAT